MHQSQTGRGDVAGGILIKAGVWNKFLGPIVVADLNERNRTGCHQLMHQLKHLNTESLTWEMLEHGCRDEDIDGFGNPVSDIAQAI